MNRREFLRWSALGAAAAAWPTELSARGSNNSGRLIRKMEGASLPRKIELLQEFYENVAFHKSGIMYAMMRLDADGVRPFAPPDFEGKIGINPAVGKLQLDGPWDYLHGENSIMVSSLYLAAQTYRYEVTRSRKALAQARQAFRSLDLIYQMGEKDGKPGYLGKPYGFRPSVQTVPDQYLDAVWGLWNYHRIAPDGDRRRIERMLISFADYWRGVDYVNSYFGVHWDLKGENGAYAAVFAVINACAHAFSQSPVHRQEFEKWMAKSNWTKATALTSLRDTVRQQIQERGKAEVVPYSAAFSLAKDHLKPGECLCWETVVHSKFVAVAAELIVESKGSDLSGRLPEILKLWWSEWKYGVGDDMLPYYWFAVDLVQDTWRPMPTTKLLPKEQWLFGDPFTSYMSQVRWNEPLARFAITSAIAAPRCPQDRDRIVGVGRRMLESLDHAHLHWIYDPDGQQLLPEISYYGQCLSSEVPVSFLAAYWKGRKDRLW